jgi:acetyl-CoA carboxylase carboxyl transferase subunit beta
MPGMSSSHIDVSIEHKRADPAERDGDRSHPNTCPGCGSHYRNDELAEHLRVCPQCGHHFPVRAPERVAQLSDPAAFEEEDAELRSADPLEFFDLKPYTERLAQAELDTGLGDAILTGTAAIDGHPCRLAAMDFSFLGGSMGSVVGERFARACERAAEDRGTVVSISASGGARMQEGILALMQLPKTVAAVGELHDSGGALTSFAGPRVVAQTTREKLPDDFGLAESNLRFGHVDAVVPRAELRPTLARLLRLFGERT